MQKIERVYESMARVLRAMAIIARDEPHEAAGLLAALQECERTVPELTHAELEYASYLAGLMRWE